MAGYIDLKLQSSDPNVLAAAALDYLIANLPGWLPAEGHLEVWMIEALAHMVAESATVAGLVPIGIFRYFGKSLIHLPAIDAAKATTRSTWTMVDNQGYTIPDGTLVAYRRSGDTLVPFRTVGAVTVPNGSTTTGAGEVVLAASDPGAAANGIAATAFVMIDSLVFVSSVVSTTVTSGGADAESDAAYLDRLAAELALMTPRPILPNDFAVLARRVAGVYRALPLDGYDPIAMTSGNARMVTLAMVDVDGNAVSSTVKDQVTAMLTAMREINFIVNTVDPSYTAIDVAFTATALPGYLASDVQARAIAAVTSFLSPATWAGGSETPPSWRSDNKVRYLELATELNLVIGLDHVTTLTIMTVAGDYTLTGVAPLPTPGTITGTVT